ncbi:hypothetical protein BSKO_05479 [Bryopsis sp. KO-2023]|nr:hypothetical protein BSKO_05479 [Bryopsis sp. KO-2023]
MAEQPGASAPKFAVLVVAWYLFTLISNMSGKSYVKATLDSVSPTTISMACAALVFMAYQVPALKALLGGAQDHSEAKFSWAFHRWAIGLGFIQFLATALSYSSFALSSVSWTYCFRTLEPLISASLQYYVAAEKITRKEFGALVVLAAGIVVTVNSGSGSQSYAAWLGGLALIATVIYSTRSVIGSKVMKSYKRSGSDVFLLASTYGCGFSLWLQLTMAVVQGGFSIETRWNLVQPLLIAGVFHCVYNLMSFQILHLLQPVAHGVCNTMKRVFMVVMSALLSGHLLNLAELFGVIVANLGAGVYGYEAKTRREQRARMAKMQAGSNLNLEAVGLLGAAEEAGKSDAPTSAKSVEQGELHSKMATRLVTCSCLSSLVGVVFLAVSMRALDVRKASLEHETAPSGTKNLISATQEFVFRQTSPDVLKDVDPDQLVFEHNEFKRMRCLTAINREIDAKFHGVFSGAKNSVSYVDVGSHPYGHGVILSGALRAAGANGKSIGVFCTLPDTDDDEGGGPTFMGCDDSDIHEHLGENSLVMFGSGAIWGDQNTNAQANRLELLEDVDSDAEERKTHLVQIPNTLAYQGSDISDRELRILQNLSNFRMFVRDEKGRDFGKELLPKNLEVEHCPDMGFRVGPLLHTQQPKQNVLILLTRMDLSAAYKDEIEANLSSRNITWGIGSWDKAVKQGPGDFDIHQYSEQNLLREVDLLSTGLVVITDDSKAAMLCILLGKAHVLIESVHTKRVGLPFDDLEDISPDCTLDNLHQLRVDSLAQALDESMGLIDKMADKSR